MGLSIKTSFQKPAAAWIPRPGAAQGLAAQSGNFIEFRLSAIRSAIHAGWRAPQALLNIVIASARSIAGNCMHSCRSLIYALDEAFAEANFRIRSWLGNTAHSIGTFARRVRAFPVNTLTGIRSLLAGFKAGAHRADAAHPAPLPTQRIATLISLLRDKWAKLRYWIHRSYRFVRAYASDTPVQEQALNISVFLFGTMIAMGGHFAVQHYSESRAQSDFERPGKEVVIFLNETMNRHVAMLESAQRRFTTKKAVPNRWKFFQSTRNTLKDLPGIQALEWIPRVRTKYRARYEKRAVKDGLFGFSFFGPDGKKYRAKDREHFPIYYVEPYPGNESTLGFDLATDPAALDALRTARDTGKPVTTRLTAIDTGQKPGAGDNTARDAPGIVVVLPVYNTEIPPFTVKERRRRIRGFIRGVVRLDRMVQAYRSNLSVPPGLEVAFYSHSKDGKPNLRYHNPPLPAKTKALPFPKAGKTDDINLSAGFRIVDQDWTMVLRPESRLFLRNLSSAAWGFAIFALLTTAILLLYLITSQTRTRAIERSVTERTAALESEIAQRKQIEIELRAAKDEAVDANHAKSEFLAIMSHELRTPLNAISGFSEVMTNEVYGTLGHKNYGDYASFIYDSADHLHSLINDILDLSKIEAARYEIHKEIIDVAEAWRPVEEMMVEKIAAAKISLKNRLSETPACIRADDRALRQIFLNLLSNAVKFTPEGGQIDITSKFDDTGRFIISVQDTGIGISKEDLALVFEPFKQVESKVARKHKGTGLGLPLTQRLVALHGGQVKIESVLGHGTTVHIVLEPSAVVYDSGEPPETPGATDKNGNQEEFKYAAG